MMAAELFLHSLICLGTRNIHLSQGHHIQAVAAVSAAEMVVAVTAGVVTVRNVRNLISIERIRVCAAHPDRHFHNIRASKSVARRS